MGTSHLILHFRAMDSLATLCLSTTSGPDPGELPCFWGSMVFGHVPISRKGLSKQQQHYFSSIGKKLVNKLATPQKHFCEFLGFPIFMYKSMFLNPTLVAEIRKIISKMQPQNRSGINEIPISVVNLVLTTCFLVYVIFLTDD